MRPLDGLLPVLIPALLLLPGLPEKQARYCRNTPSITLYRHCPLSFYYCFGRFCMFPHLPGMHKRCVRCAKFWMVGFTGCLLPAGRNDGEVRLARFMDELTSAGLGCCVANVWVAGQRF